MKQISVFFATILIGLSSQAALQFNLVTQSDLDNITSDLTANFAFSSINGGSSLGKVFGFEFGIVGDMTTTSKIETVVKAQDPTATGLNPLYSGGILGRLSVPFGFTLELMTLPKVNTSGAQASLNSFGVSYSLSDSGVVSWPVDVAFKANITQMNLSFTETFSNASTGNVPVNGTVESKNTITGYQVFISKNLVLFEPYFGIGMIQGKNDLTVTGTAAGTIFSPSLTGSQSASSTQSGTEVTIGTEMKLVFFKLGLEYAQLMGTSRVGAKLAFYF